MQTPPGHEPEEKTPIFGTHLGDLGVVVIAALCTVTLALILLSPSPFQKLERAQAAQEKAQTAKEQAEGMKAGETHMLRCSPKNQ